MAGRRERKSASIEEFYAEENRAGLSEEEFAKRVYIQVHSLYLRTDGKTKPEFGRWWKNLTGIYMEDSIFEYMHDNEPILTMDKLSSDVREKKEITSMKFLVKTIVALEFDLWMIERYNNCKELDLMMFKNYMTEKYGSFCDRQFSNFRKFDLYGISSYEEIAKELSPYHDKIKEFYDCLYEGNKRKIDIDHTDVSRVNDYKGNTFSVEAAKKETNETGRLEGNFEKSTPSEKISEEKQESVVETNKNKIDRESQFVIQQMEERIEKLERDIKEFKRQRDDAREYSINQYDKGIKDLFNAMNDVRYGKVLDYFFSLLSRDDIDDNLASYIENLFMIFEDMEIEPIVENDNFDIDEANLTRDFNLDFDKNEYAGDRVKIKYVGWKYKDTIMEKPTLKLDK